MTKLIVNCTTGETIERELNEEEKAQEAIDAAEFLAKLAEKEAAENAKQSALAKLAALGLTAEEISALNK